MTLDDLKNAKATYDLYGATMVNSDVMNFLFDSAISLKEQIEGQAVLTKFDDKHLIEPVTEDAPKPKRTVKKAD